jgi:hypothetical protein
MKTSTVAVAKLVSNLSAEGVSSMLPADDSRFRAV